MLQTHGSPVWIACSNSWAVTGRTWCDRAAFGYRVISTAAAVVNVCFKRQPPPSRSEHLDPRDVKHAKGPQIVNPCKLCRRHSLPSRAMIKFCGCVLSPELLEWIHMGQLLR
jgi:hypothetical protein